MMSDSEIDLLAITRGSITAPAGCGKTHLIAQALRRHDNVKPVLVLTHTNAGVAALRVRLDKARVPPGRYRLSTLDGWALRLLSAFPKRSGIDPTLLALAKPKTDYPAIRKAAAILMRDGHINDILKSSFARLIIDEYQDCGTLQHAMAAFTSLVLPTVVLGDPMQAIFGWAGDVPDWEGQVCDRFPTAGELTTPWRWENAGTKSLGLWLLDVRKRLKNGEPVDLKCAPPEVTWVSLDGKADRERQLRAGMTKAVDGGEVLIIGDARSPPSQRRYASQLPGAVTVESVELGDLVEFAGGLDFAGRDALAKIATFAASVMTNVGSADLIKRVEILERGRGRKDPSDVERAALRFQQDRSPAAVVDLLVEISKEPGVRTHRPTVLRACIRALQSCEGSDLRASFYQGVIQAREQNRLIGRPLPKRAVGSTLLLKGLEAEVAVLLDTTGLDARNLYVAMTRGSKRLIICSSDNMLRGG
ncbi:UvrD-helicase domain-containing protein [Kaistia sp. MMO-174]|uniref:UvrD-helicase domain-containing protein n=1 Tax=Kaistia sp. MMO-174 TaxID=3081256 RepID=UPI003018FC74